MTIDPTFGLAKAIEKASEATTEVVRASREAGHFWAPALRQLVGMAEDALTMRRKMGQVRLAEKYQGFMRERGLEAATREIAPAFLLPLIERASLGDADDLQDVWAMMLANAADAGSGADMRTAFVAMLGEMTHLDVAILGKLAAVRDCTEFPHGLPTGMLPQEVARGGEHRLSTDPVAISLTQRARRVDL